MNPEPEIAKQGAGVWLDEARKAAEVCLCSLNATETVAQCISGWMDTAAQNQRNADYYKGLVVRCGKAMGKEAYTQDDGGICDEVLCAKVPELVEKLVGSIKVSVRAPEFIPGKLNTTWDLERDLSCAQARVDELRKTRDILIDSLHRAVCKPERR